MHRSIPDMPNVQAPVGDPHRAGLGSPATAPHIWQVKPFRSRTNARVSLEMLSANVGFSELDQKQILTRFQRVSIIVGKNLEPFVGTQFSNPPCPLADSCDCTQFIGIQDLAYVRKEVSAKPIPRPRRLRPPLGFPVSENLPNDLGDPARDAAATGGGKALPTWR